jgi:hypothetical protein
MIQEIPDRVGPACEKAMKPMLDRVLAEVPRATGNLAAKIQLKVGKPRRGRARVGVFFSGVRYGSFVTLGTKRREANDFMQRAFAAQGERSADMAVEGILKGIDQI